jgi:hypothetical protein
MGSATLQIFEKLNIWALILIHAQFVDDDDHGFENASLFARHMQMRVRIQ